MYFIYVDQDEYLYSEATESLKVSIDSSLAECRKNSDSFPITLANRFHAVLPEFETTEEVFIWLRPSLTVRFMRVLNRSLKAADLAGVRKDDDRNFFESLFQSGNSVKTQLIWESSTTLTDLKKEISTSAYIQ
jgi:hypothetical protein